MVESWASGPAGALRRHSLYRSYCCYSESQLRGGAAFSAQGRIRYCSTSRKTMKQGAREKEISSPHVTKGTTVWRSGGFCTRFFEKSLEFWLLLERCLGLADLLPSLLISGLPLKKNAALLSPACLYYFLPTPPMVRYSCHRDLLRVQRAHKLSSVNSLHISICISNLQGRKEDPSSSL